MFATQYDNSVLNPLPLGHKVSVLLSLMKKMPENNKASITAKAVAMSFLRSLQNYDATITLEEKKILEEILRSVTAFRMNKSNGTMLVFGY